jgi:hypothetical protein
MRGHTESIARRASRSLGVGVDDSRAAGDGIDPECFDDCRELVHGLPNSA